MKNIIIAILSVVVIGIGTVQASEKSEKGEWRVINSNCPKVLAEKDGQKKVFRFKASREMLYPRVLKECLKVKTGWTITVEENGKYYFFPPTSNQRR